MESQKEKLIRENNKLLELLREYSEVISEQEIQIEELKKEIIKLKNQNGGRPESFDKKQKDEIIRCRAEGKTVKLIAEQFKCSMSTINRILSERKEEK